MARPTQATGIDGDERGRIVPITVEQKIGELEIGGGLYHPVQAAMFEIGDFLGREYEGAERRGDLPGNYTFRLPIGNPGTVVIRVTNDLMDAMADSHHATGELEAWEGDK